VVTGKVVSVKYLTEPGIVLPKPAEEMTTEEKYKHGIADKIVTIRIQFIVKGKNIPKNIEVVTAIDGASCGIHFETGKTYIIYAQPKDLEKHIYTTGLCSTTKIYEKTEWKSLKRIKKGKI